jgi:hypothetical protein
MEIDQNNILKPEIDLFVKVPLLIHSHVSVMVKAQQSNGKLQSWS